MLGFSIECAIFSFKPILMKNLLLVFTIVLVFSCGSKTDQKADFSQMTFSLDTVIVDSKGGIIMGATNLFLSDFDRNLSTLYHYSNTTAEVEVIDLGNLSIKERIKVETDGPNGVGSNVHRLYFLSDSLFVFDNYFGLTYLEKTSKNIKRIKYREFEFFIELQEKADRFTNNFCFLNSGSKFISPVNSRENDFKFLALVDLESDQMEKIEIEGLKAINDFNVTLNSGNSQRSISQPVNMLKVHDMIYISNTANNNIFTYNIQTKELKKLTIKADKLSAGKSGIYKNETDDYDEFAEIFRRMAFEIEYNELIRNPSNGNFYRFSKQKIREKTDDIPSKYNIHLVVYDKDFVLLGEALIPGMNDIPQVYFWKNNRIWLHENVEDELGFVRLSINN